MTDQNEETLFHLARQKTGSDRAAYLDETCRDNPDLRRRLEGLLEADDDPHGFMQSPPIDPPPNVEGPGTQIGRYKLLQQIGEGGMGIVFMAEQTHPVQRKVALKIIKAGMDSRQVIARFEAERQALALMDHPNIARVLDAGTTPSGRPFFVMELVKGTPITEYCDKHRASPKERLELFISVCQAVQHAHQKGIIHRDLKPSNVLVAQYDGKPLPKVIDFGVAKATGPKLTDRTLFTEFGAIVGTLEYMSPEEAGLDQLDIDTRSDIYSLGVLLYELLTGTTPLERKHIKEAALFELLRLVREQEPQRPSTRLSHTDQAPTISANRGLELPKLTRLIRGELDWIVMKALEKDRSRRYESASALAEDVQRHLSDEPVTARPASTRYRLRKFVARHRIAVSAGAAILAVLVAGALGTTLGMLRAINANAAEKKQRQEAENARAESDAVNRFMIEMFEAADPSNALGQSPLARTVLDRAARRLDSGSLKSQPNIEAAVRSTLASTYYELGMYATAEAQCRAALRIRQLQGLENRHVAANLTQLALILCKKGELHEAETLNQQALQIQRKLLGDQHPDLAASLNNMGLILMEKGDYPNAESNFRQSLLIRRKTAPDVDPDLATVLNNLGLVLAAKGDSENAEKFFRQALDMRRKLYGAVHPLLANSMNTLGLLLCQNGDARNAEPLLRQALDMRRILLGDRHPDVATSMNNLAQVLVAKNQLVSERKNWEEARGLYTRALAILRAELGDQSPKVATVLDNLAYVLWHDHDLNGAEPLLREALAIERKVVGQHPDLATALNNMARFLQDKGELGEAEALLREALTIQRQTLPEKHPNIAIAALNLARLLKAKGDLLNAELFYKKAIDIGQGSKGIEGEMAKASAELAALQREGGRTREADLLDQQAKILQLKETEQLLRNKGWFPSLLPLDQREPWRKDMQRCVDSVRMAQTQNGKPVNIERVAQPLIRYDQEFRIVQDASIWAWGVKTRPLALLTIEVWQQPGGQPAAHFRCISLSDEPFVFERQGADWRWSPKSSAIKFNELPQAAPPQDTDAERLNQMKSLPIRFMADEVQRGNINVALQLLPEPIYRYGDPASDVIDGTLSCFALHGAPEAVLILEARKRDGSLKWYYAFAQITEQGVFASLDGKEVWSASAKHHTAPDDAFWLPPAETCTPLNPTTKNTR